VNTPTELTAPAERSPEEMERALVEALQPTDVESAQGEVTFLDSFDGRLYEAGVTAAFFNGRLAVSKRSTGELVATVRAAAPVGPVTARALPAGELRESLAEILEVRALLPIARVHLHTVRLAVHDDERKTVVRLAFERPTLLSASGWRTSLPLRLRLEPVRGYDEEFDGVSTAVRDLGFARAGRPLVDEAVIAAGGRPEGVSAKIELKLAFSGRADAGAAAVLRRLGEVMEANLEGTIADTDPEFLHDLRVAVRRSRSVQRELRNVFPADRLQYFRDEFKWLQLITGDTRDLDVYVLEFDDMRELVPETMRADLDPVLKVLESRRLVAHSEMTRALRSDRAAALRADWEAFLDELVGLPDEDRLDARRPIGELAGERIGRVYRRMVRMGSAIDDSSPAEDYHELRKKGKELRYLLELFGRPLFTAEVVGPMVKTLKSLQDVLGRHQDREVQVATLRALADEVSARPGGPAALMAMGVLVERLAADERAARSEFADHFEPFASQAQRKLVKATF
jgi:CHAD domain-containing protein